MPIYEYQCTRCNCEFELLIRGDDTARCPKCHNRKVNKLLSVPAAPATSNHTLPVCGSSPAVNSGCGLPQCGGGRCQFDR